ncbi:MAG: inositol monophosphatase family protein [Candidatus Saccharibacteria bacterium]|nr:inositol monophosphatase family protein [Candidatus Saccharibacteria bacterium]
MARANFGNLSHSVKAGDRNQVLTVTDLAIGHFLTDAIRSKYPNHNIIDEELGCVDNGSRYTWVVDPIDGTSNFAAGLPQYGIMLGLLDHNTPVAGGIALPAFDELYVAIKGVGAWCNGKKIYVSRETDLANNLVAYGIDGHPEDPARTKHEAELLGAIIQDLG